MKNVDIMREVVTKNNGELPKKRGLHNLYGAWQKIGSMFLRQGWYLDAHYDLILVHAGLKIGLDVSALNFDLSFLQFKAKKKKCKEIFLIWI